MKDSNLSRKSVFMSVDLWSNLVLAEKSFTKKH